MRRSPCQVHCWYFKREFTPICVSSEDKYWPDNDRKGRTVHCISLAKWFGVRTRPLSAWCTMSEKSMRSTRWYPSYEDGLFCKLTDIDITWKICLWNDWLQFNKYSFGMTACACIMCMYYERYTTVAKNPQGVIARFRLELYDTIYSCTCVDWVYSWTEHCRTFNQGICPHFTL